MAESLHPYVLKVQVSSTATTRKEVLQIARSQLGPLQVTPGCLGIRLYEDIESPNTFTWEEKWSSMELLERRIASEKFRTILAMVDISKGLPDIYVAKVTNENGMKWISKIREKKAFKDQIAE